MLVVHAEFPIKPEARDKAVESAQQLAENSRREDGVLEYRVTEDTDDENTLFFVERYEDEAAFDAHAETDHFGEFEAEVSELLAGKPQVTRFDVSETAEVGL
jgi:quinol monooxygenase YgiN